MELHIQEVESEEVPPRNKVYWTMVGNWKLETDSNSYLVTIRIGDKSGRFMYISTDYFLRGILKPEIEKAIDDFIAAVRKAMRIQ